MHRRDFFKWGFMGVSALVFTKKASALEYYPMPSDKKWAIIYGTWCGSSRDAAIWISEGMGGIANVFDVRENPNPLEFDHIVIGGSIRNSVTRQELQDYIRENQSVLKEKVRALFAVCGNMGRPVGEEQITQFIDNHLARLCGVTGLPSKVFLGRITKILLDPQTAQMMAGFEDYDNLKRAECMAFGREILDKMSSTMGKALSFPKEFHVEQNYPNPFNLVTTMQYSLNTSGHIILTIYDAKGKKVRTLFDGFQHSGEHAIQWDGRDDFGNTVASGTYFYMVMFNGSPVTPKMLVVR